MVKASAYGHGIRRVVPFACLEKGIRSFGVATPQEALELKAALDGVQARVFVFSGPPLQEVHRLYLEESITPVLSSLEDIRFFLENTLPLPLCMKFNTGMNRLGIHWERVEDVCKLLRRYGRKQVEHLMSHFANASFPASHELNILQRERFDRIKGEFKAQGFCVHETSMANSAAIERGMALDASHIRPGLMLYGPSALENGFESKRKTETTLVSTLKARVLEVHRVKKQDPVGYGGVPCDGWGQVVVVSMGYADGLARAYGGGCVPYDGGELKFFGKVSMDMAHLFSPKDGPCPKVGEEITLWSEDNFKNLSKHSNLSPHEMLCLLGHRLPRIYVLG